MKTIAIFIMAILASVMVFAAADLTVSNLEVSDLRPTVENMQTTLRVTVSNTGDTAAGLFHYTINTTGESLRTLVAPPLAAGGSYVDLVDITFTSTGAKNITVSLDSASEVSEDNESNNNATLPVTIASGSPQMSFASSGALSLSVDQGKTSVSGTVTLTNSGNTDLENISLSMGDLEDGSKDISGSKVTLSPESFDLDIGESKAITVTVPLDKAQPIDTYAGTLTASAGSLSATKSISVKVNKPSTDSKLEIKKVKIAIGEDEDDFSSLDLGEEEEVAPGDKINFEVYVENNHKDLEIEDIEVKVEIEGDDWDDDKEEDVDDLKEGKDNDDEPAEFSFEVDDDVEDGDEYDVTITVEGRDEDGDVHTDIFTATLKVEQEADDLEIKSFTVDNDDVACGGSAKLTIKVENKGTSRQKEAYVTLKNSALGIDSVLSEMKIDEAGDDGDTVTKSVNLNFANKRDLRGTYTVTANVYDDDNEKMDTANVDLKFSCTERTTSRSSTSTSASGTTGTSGQETLEGNYSQANITSIEDDVDSNTGFVVAIVILSILVVGLGAVVAVSQFKPKEE